MTQRDWSMNDVLYLIDGGYMGIYDGWIAACLKDGRIVNRWDKDDYRYERTQEFINKQEEGEALWVN